MTRQRSGIDFDPEDSDAQDGELELDWDVVSADEWAPKSNVRHDAAPAHDPNAMKSRVSWDDTSAPPANAAVKPLFVLVLILLVLAAAAASWWVFQPSEEGKEVREYIKSQTF